MAERDVKAEEVVKAIARRAAEIPYHNMYAAMRHMGIKNITQKAVNMGRVAVAIHEKGLPITTTLVGFVVGTETLSTLHSLGDKGLLTLNEKLTGRSFSWRLSDSAMEVLWPPAEGV